MCHSWVKRIIRWDKKKIFRFAPLESETAKKLLTPILPEYIKEDTIIYYDEGRIYMRSNAAIQILEDLGYNLLALSKFVPKKLRDNVYRWVANRRYKYGPRYNSCPLPPVEWRDRFME